MPERILVGVAWPYANSHIHFGFIAGVALPADIFARFHRMKGNEVLMVSGSDEHGTPITIAADKEGIPPEEIATKFHNYNIESLEKMGITFDLFFRTSHPNHKKIVQDIFLKLLDKGHIYKKVTNAYYCMRCKRFLPDRYLSGKCPYCRFEDARGDECDSCDRVLETEELIEPVCRICRAKPEIRDTEHFYFKLSAFQDRIAEFVKDKIWWRPNTQQFTQNWLRMGLKDRVMSRDISWGVEIPLLGYETKRIYVWFEALMGYLSTSIEWARLTGNPDKWKDFWCDGNTKSYYFLGKNNIPFHTIIWPAIIMGYGELNLPYDVPANEFLQLGGKKISKSRTKATSILVHDYLKEYEPDPLRYYLSVHMPEHHDTEFSWDEFAEKNNSDLVSTLGNFAHRVLSFTYNNFRTIPPVHELNELDKQVVSKIEETYKEVTEALEKCHFKDAITKVMALAHFGNSYFNQKEPWKLLKENKKACETTLHISLRIVKVLSILITPFIPYSSDKLWKLLGYQDNIYSQNRWLEIVEDVPTNQNLPAPKPIFKKIKLEKEEEATNKELLDEFLKLDIRIGKIIDVKNHPNADKLYVMKIDFDAEQRHTVAGIKKWYKPEELVNRKVVAILNLQQTEIRGQKSEGMILAAEDSKGVVSLLKPEQDVKEGTKIVYSKSHIPQKFGTIVFSELQKLEIQVCEILKVDKVESGCVLSLKGKDELNSLIPEPLTKDIIGKKVIVFLGSKPDGKEGIVFRTENRIWIISDKEIELGAKIR